MFLVGLGPDGSDDPDVGALWDLVGRGCSLLGDPVHHLYAAGVVLNLVQGYIFYFLIDS